MKKKVIIIGAGISGLTAGVYALKSGFDAEIYEQHSISGGLCTSWKRKGYTFEGAVHWLTGSNESAPLYKIFKDTGALSRDVEMFRNDPYWVYEYNGKKVYLYRSLDKLKEEFLKISPEDKKAIIKLCKEVKALTVMKMPIMYLKGLKVKNKSKMKFSDLMKMLPALSKYKKFNNISMEEYVKRFKHKGLIKLLLSLVPEGYSALGMVVTLGTFITQGEYPKGGSLAMTKRMEDKFKSLGGKIFFNSKVDKVVIENGAAKGIIISEKTILADAVIITLDTLKAAKSLFDKPLKEEWIENLNSNSQLCTFVSLGIKADLKDLPHSMFFDLNKPIEIAGIKYEQMGFFNYSSHSEYAPKSCSALTVNFIGDSYEFWDNAKKKGGYESAKKSVADTVSGVLEEKFPKIKGNIEVIDVATPLTYERFTGAYKGSWMTIMAKGNKMNINVGKSESVKNLYFAGFRLIAPGGLPVALMTGFRAAQLVCKDFNYVFEGEK